LSTDEVLVIVDSLPTEVCRRLRARVLSESTDASVDCRIEELSVAIAQRDPAGDDIAMVDRVVRLSAFEGLGDLREGSRARHRGSAIVGGV
jgi:hypothetical protein